MTKIEREGRKDYGELSDDEVMAQRLVDAVELERLWQAVSDMYGNKATKTMRDLLPADPLYLKDFFVYEWLNEGKSEADIQKMLDSYTHEDWTRELGDALPHIKNMLQTIKDNKFTTED